MVFGPQSFAAQPTFVPQTAVAQTFVGNQFAPQYAQQVAVQPRQVDRQVTVSRHLVPESRTVQVPRVIPTQHTVLEAQPYTYQEPHTVTEQITHTVQESHQVFEPRTVTVPRTVFDTQVITEQHPRTVMDTKTIQVPKTILENQTIREPRTVLEPVQRTIQVPHVIQEQQQIQVPRTEFHARQVVQQVPRVAVEARQVVQQVPRTVQGQRTILHQQAVHTARIVEVPRITEIERPQVVQHVIPGQQRQYTGAARFVGQVQQGVSHVGTYETAQQFVAPVQQQQFVQTQFAAPVQQQFVQAQQQFVAPTFVSQQGAFASQPAFHSGQFVSAGYAGFPQFASQAIEDEGGFRA